MKTNFKDPIKLNESVQGINDYYIGYVITYALHMVSQIRLWHLLYTDGQKHAALGLLYEEVQEEVDGLAEKFIAQGGKLETISESLMANYSDEAVILKLQEYRDIITSAINQRPDMASINDSLIDLQEAIDKNLYKFKLG